MPKMQSLDISDNLIGDEGIRLVEKDVHLILWPLVCKSAEQLTGIC